MMQLWFSKEEEEVLVAEEDVEPQNQTHQVQIRLTDADIVSSEDLAWTVSHKTGPAHSRSRSIHLENESMMSNAIAPVGVVAEAM
jgi:hypothetical protein